MEKSDRELLELIATKVGGLETRMQAVEKTTTKTELMIENEIIPKIEVLFDGYLQNSDKLDRLERAIEARGSYLEKVK